MCRGISTSHSGKFPHNGRHTRPRGQSLLEFALIAPVFFALLFGTLDVGMAFKTRSAYQEAALQAVRVAAASGQELGADDDALHAFQTTLSTEDLRNISSIEVFDATVGAPSSVVNTYVYDSASKSFVCAPTSDCSSTSSWAPTQRSISVSQLDNIGIRVTYSINSVLNLLPPVHLVETASTTLEPWSY